ncbi:MAG: permease prefix domain 1-containing protein [Oscillospiraceae bacterium]|jgi:hypothetical protein
MEEKLSRFIDTLFEDAAQNSAVAELKQEMTMNLIDKYNDLLAEGRSEETAYNMAVASVGDVRGLIDEIENPGVKSGEARDKLHRSQKKSAAMLAIAIALYIICVVPIILLQSELGVILMFVIIAAATALVIYYGMTKRRYVRMDETVVEEFKEWKESTNEKRQILRALNGVLWTVCVAVYFILSFTTGAWHITWVIFPIAAALSAALRAAFELKG